MALPTLALINGGVCHASAEGTVDVGVGLGQVPALGNNQLMTVDLTAPFTEQLRRDDRFQDQVYITAISRGAGLTRVALDATQFNTDAAGLPTQLRLRVDLTAPTDLYLRVSLAHSAVR